ncbi:MAG TPA: glycoside hydrolase family 5 protein [Xanthobacteraceae bacterium]|nr:glycoside hydrolase family 5 protein [Xanthobacteraceae bacterium]
MIGRIKLGAGFVIFAAAIALIAPPPSQTRGDYILPLTGVNIAGADFGADKIPGVPEQDYTYPKTSSIDYFAAKGMNIIRMPLLWERLQRKVGGPLEEAEIRRVDDVVNYTTSKGMKVIIDIHNYASYSKSKIGTRETPIDALGHLWSQIAARYKNTESVIFGLMNEPTGLPTEVWLQAANIAIAEIRRAGAANLILVPGNGWSSARDWLSSKYGIPNSRAMLKVMDPAKNYVFEVHQYFDRDFTGTHAECRSVDIGERTLTPFTLWARKHRKRGFLGEFGVGRSPTCLENLDRVLRFMAANNDVWLGWAYWAAGTWWEKDYYTNIEPYNGQTRPQMMVLEKYLKNTPPRIP